MMKTELREALKNKKDFDEIPKIGRLVPLESLFTEPEKHELTKYSSILVEYGGINYVIQASRALKEKVSEGTKVIRDVQNKFVGIEAIKAGSHF